MKLFEVAKVGMFLDTITHGTETRQGDEVKIVTLTLRVQPFDVKLAGAIERGVRATLFKLNDGDPQGHLKRVDFKLGCPRQQLHVFAAPDTGRPSILLDQVKIAATYARVDKDANGFSFIVKASFGPVGKTELAFLENWRLNQQFVTCEPAEPGLFPDDRDEHEPEGEDPARPAPMFDDEAANA